MNAPIVTAAVAGANGYAGMTLVQLLARHPNVRLTQLTSRSYAGRPYRDVFPLLDQPGNFIPLEELDASGVDVVFSCLTHNVCAAQAGAWLSAGARVIDMSADFRLSDPSLYPRWYRQEHPAPELLTEAVLGLPELHGPALREARLIAVPGCYSTAAILALAPAVSAGLVAGPDIVVDAKSGVSGAGRSPGLGTHFAEVAESVHAYAIAGHRHLAELTQELGLLSPGPAPQITFVPHLIPMVRGILATCYFDVDVPLARLEETYQDFYRASTFTRIVAAPPQTKLASHSNQCLVNLSVQGRKAVVTSALDNLVKGASGQGVECFNLAFGLPPRAGLEVSQQWP